MSEINLVSDEEAERLRRRSCARLSEKIDPVKEMSDLSDWLMKNRQRPQDECKNLGLNIDELLKKIDDLYCS